MQKSLFRSGVLLLLALVFHCVVVSPALGRTVSGTAHLVNNHVTKIAKFSYRPVGISSVTGVVRYRGAEPRGAVYLFMDPEWENYHQTSDACTRMSKATAAIHIGTDNNDGKGWITNRNTREVEHNTFEFTFTWNIEHRVRTYGYYLVLGDCKPSPTKRVKVLDYKFTFLNDGYDHFPSDEYGMFSLYLLCFLALAGFGVQRVLAYRGRRGESGLAAVLSSFSEGPPPAAVSLLMISYGCYLVSLFLVVLHLWRYKYDGAGLFVVDFFSEVFEGIAQTCIAYLLLAFAGGWTLVEGTINAKSDGVVNPEALGEDHVATMFLGFITVITFVLQLLSKLLLYDEFTKFHDHDSWPGFFLIIVRLSLAIFFTWQITRTLNYMKLRKHGKSNTLKFLQNLSILGGIWFWVFPILVFVSGIFAHYLRHRIVSGGVVLLQTSCLIIVTKQIFEESSLYSKASLHRGGILGGGT